MILVVGSQRTGSTLMSMCIGAHPQTNYVGDVILTNLIDGKYKHGDVLHAVVWTARYSLINEHFPDNKYVFMLRDLRAIASSMMAIGWAEKYALEETSRAILGIPDWHKQCEVTAYLGKVYREGDYVKAATLCAYLKSYQLVFYRRWLRNVFPVRYEALVERPQSIMESVLDFLDLPWDDSVLQHHLVADGNEYAGNDPKRPIDAQSVDKWKTQLSDKEIYTVWQTVDFLDGIFDGFAKEHRLI